MPHTSCILFYALGKYIVADVLEKDDGACSEPIRVGYDNHPSQ